MQRSQKETVTLEDIVITEEVFQRNPRAANLVQENQALHALAQQLVNQPQTMLQNLVDITLELCNTGTVGVSLLELTANGEEIFRWNVLAGALAHYVGGTTPRHFSPCGVCLDRGTPQLYSYPNRYFTYLQAANTPIVEGLVLPLIADNHALGTIWILSHDEQRHFDSEDVRVMTSLADFAAAALLLNQRQTQELLAKNAQLEAEAAERQRAEKLVRESEAYFRAMMENLPGGAAFVVDRNLRYLLAEGEALHTAGFKSADLVGKTIFEVLSHELAANYEVNYQRALAGEPFEHEHNAHNRTYISRGTPLRADNGEIYAVLAVSYDITERKRAEVALRESEARLQAVANLVPDLLWDSEPDGSTNWYNQQWMEYTGQTFEQAIGWGWIDAIHPGDRQGSAQRYREAVEQGMPLLQEHRIRRHDGAYRWFVVKASPLKDENGKVIKMYGAATDIHNRKQAEDALRESEEKYRSLFNSMDEAYAVVEVLSDENGEWNDFLFLEVNPAFVAQTGMEYPVGRKATELLGTPNPEWAKVYGQVAATGAPIRFEEGEATLGRVFDLYVFRLGGDGSRRVAVLFTDITDRKRREANLALIAKISEDFANLASETEIMQSIGARLASHLRLDGFNFCDVDEVGGTTTVTYVWNAAGVPQHTGTYRIADYMTEEFVQTMRRGEIWVVYDTQGDDRVNPEATAAIGLGAYIVIPYHRQGEWTGCFTATDRRARHWTTDEIALIQDVTSRTFPRLERARTETSLHESEAKYRSLFNSIDAGFCIFEMLYNEAGEAIDFRYIETNPAFERQTGRIPQPGQTMRELFPETEDMWLKDYAEVARTGQPKRFIDFHAELDRWFDVFVFPTSNGKNQLAALFSDVSESKRAEEQLRRAAEMDAFRLKLSDALRSLTDPVEIQTEAMRILGEHLQVDLALYAEVSDDGEKVHIPDAYVSGAVPKITGDFPVNDFGGAVIETMRRGEVSLVNDVSRAPEITEAVLPAYTNLNIAAFVVAPLVKSNRWVSNLAIYHASPREWRADEIAILQETAERTWATVERARAENAMRELEIQRFREQSAREEERQRAEALAELDRAKTLFFSNVSHEFRTPLTLLLAPLQDALSDSANPIPPAQRERLELSHRNSLRLLKLVNTLLDFSRIEAGRMEAVYEPTDLAMFTTELASVFRSAIERAGLRLVVDCPPISEPVYVDREMWEKIVLNLLSNAFKFTLEGEIAVRLHLGDDHHVKLQIEDTGTGILSEELPHLFERFYQVRGAKARTHEGSGIGLALVHELIKMHGGTIEVSSTPRVGSCFTITIPLGTAHLSSDRLRRVVGDRSQVTRTLASTALGAAPYVQEAERWIGEEDMGTRGHGDAGDFSLSASPRLPLSVSSRVLIVDDNADMRDYLTRILSDRVEVQAVADGAAALAAVNERSPDLVLSDVMMPGLDGFELLKALRADARTKEVPIILLSARAGEESVIEGLLAGADDYLIKPFSATELVTRVNAYLQLAHLRSETLRQERTINHRKDEVLSTVSHELNTPLVAILGWTRLLRSSSPSQAMLMKALETIERNATLQAKLVQDLLDISRITAGKISLNLEPVELQGVIENAIATVRQSYQTKDIHLDCLLDPLPTIVQGDPERLQQIILNLLSNAVKFTPERGRIELSLQTHENQAQVIVSDTGCGIDNEFLPYIFDTFRQADGVKKGLGLGLAIARSLVELHGGTIHAHSLGIGQGTTFIVKLPLI
ncbi:MAG: ATP-binding protein [Aulosira sp. ZfuVER01]|nr:ATP-binding protein [Aulosira sp. ZfuVER01]MDZ7999443.1 ATP-binding protein [Aulosira sp. DedVER01a]MDZ8054778.1 ATP-binding protein [Aulosira sp. ZfuCHP01]